MQAEFRLLPKLRTKQGDPMLSVTFSEGPLTVALVLAPEEAKAVADRLAKAADAATARVHIAGGIA